jgi:hypothetical protein
MYKSKYLKYKKKYLELLSTLKMTGGSNGEHIIFTDPSIIGKTSTGDVDDIAAILYAALNLRNKVTFVICDDDKLIRYNYFMYQYDKKIKKYNCKVIKENDLKLEMLKDSILHIHAPVNRRTVELISNDTFNKVYLQGNTMQAVNLKPSGETFFNFLFNEEKIKSGKTIAYSTEETHFTIDYNEEFKNYYLTPFAQHIYSIFFEFETRKKIGTAATIPFLVNRLYSDTGLNNGPGSGIRPFKEIINKYLKPGNKKLDLSEELIVAVNTSLPLDKNGEHIADETTKVNVHNLIALLDMYCNYEKLLVNGLLPNMSQLGNIEKRQDCPEEIKKLFENGKTTPLFDFSAIVWSLQEEKCEKCDKGTLVKMVHKMLLELK